MVGLEDSTHATPHRMILIDKLSIVQGAFILQNVSFDIPTGRYGVLMGQTGCGKTSILECIAGLRTPSAGAIRLNDVNVTNLPPGARGVGYLPQDGALFRSMTVRQHLAFALQLRRWSFDRIAKRVDELAGWLGISHLLPRRPHGLSGGEAQRVALGRALSFHPRVLLFDEPLSSLDDDTREQMMDLLQQIHRHETVTVLHVTHNRREAERLGEVVLSMENGEVRPA